MDPFIGEIRPLPYATAPAGWALCQGQQLRIVSYPALFSLLGTQYGGNGTTTFGLPDLRGRVGLGVGQGPGLTAYPLGTVVGTETVALDLSQMPAHIHLLSATLPASAAVADQRLPAGNLYATTENPNEYGSDPQPDQLMAADLLAGTTGGAGNGEAHENRMPYLALNYCIALQGIFPARS